jgi:hypothetical protein
MDLSDKVVKLLNHKQDPSKDPKISPGLANAISSLRGDCPGNSSVQIPITSRYLIPPCRRQSTSLARCAGTIKRCTRVHIYLPIITQSFHSHQPLLVGDREMLELPVPIFPHPDDVGLSRLTHRPLEIKIRVRLFVSSRCFVDVSRFVRLAHSILSGRLTARHSGGAPSF